MRIFLTAWLLFPAVTCFGQEGVAVARQGQASQADLRKLAETRVELEKLQVEMARLEKATGFRNRVEIVARCLEVSDLTARRLGINATGPSGSQLPAFSTVSQETLRKVISSTRRDPGNIKELAVASVLTRNGEAAQMIAGGEFPIPIPTSDQKMNVTYKGFGDRFEALPRSLGNRRVQVDFTLSLSERDENQVLKVGGSVIPGVQERKMTSSVELAYGETAVLQFPVMPRPVATKGRPPEEVRGVALLLLTVNEVEARAD